MSSFQIDGQAYESIVDDDFETDAETMDVALGRVLKSGTTGRYVYDFGSSTELTLRVLGTRHGKASREPVRLVARNAAPSFKCSSCRDEACILCTACGKPVCAKCSADHRCGPEMLLPIVNSPRVGTCAYGT
jgi:hypothetical protein